MRNRHLSLEFAMVLPIALVLIAACGGTLWAAGWDAATHVSLQVAPYAEVVLHPQPGSSGIVLANVDATWFSGGPIPNGGVMNFTVNSNFALQVRCPQTVQLTCAATGFTLDPSHPAICVVAMSGVSRSAPSGGYYYLPAKLGSCDASLSVTVYKEWTRNDLGGTYEGDVLLEIVQ